jgi:hypothetical protein
MNFEGLNLITDGFSVSFGANMTRVLFVPCNYGADSQQQRTCSKFFVTRDISLFQAVDSISVLLPILYSLRQYYHCHSAMSFIAENLVIFRV